MNFDLDFYKGKKVFVTGHTGFKGSWLCKMLVNAGAIVTGYSLNPPTIGRMKNWTVMIRTPTLSPVLSWLHTPIKTASLTMIMLQFLRLVQVM